MRIRGIVRVARGVYVSGDLGALLVGLLLLLLLMYLL